MADFLTRRIFLLSFVALVLIVHPVLLSAQIPGPTAVSSPAITTEGDQALDIAKRARALASTGQYAPAITLGERALVMARAQYGPRHEYVAYILDDLATWNYQQQHFDQALQFSRQAVDIIRDAKGAESNEYASLVNNLASIHAAKGQYQQAATLYEQSYAIFAKNVGPNHERSAQLARNLGVAYLELSRFDAAKRQFAEALRATRAIRGDDSAATARAYLDLASVHLRQEATEDARKEATTARRILAGQNPVDAASLATADVMLAQIDIHDSRLDSAKARLDEALKLLDSSGASDPLVRASVLYNIGWIEILRREAVEAERVYKEVLAIYRRALSENHPSIGRVLHCLAIVYQDLGQFSESERFYQRAIDIFTASFGENDASVASTRLEYSSLLSEEGRTDDAIRQARTALAIYERLPGQWDLKRGYANAVLALAQHRAGDLTGAAKTYTVSLALITKVRGDQSSDLPPGLTDLARIHRAQNRLDDANRELDQAILIRRKDGAATPAGLAESLSELANLRVAQGNLKDALATSRQAVKIAQQRLDVAQRSLSSSALGEQRQARGLFEQFLEIGWANHASTDDALLREMFEVAQLPHLSGTSGAISQMAVRFSAGTGRLATLVRERQDTVERWRALDRSVTEGLTQTRDAAPSPASVQESRQTLVRLTQSIEKLDDTLRRDFPQYSELTNPRPVPASAVQALLKPDEALLLQVTSAQATYLFLVTGRSLRLARTELSSRQLQQAVDSIRKGLDFRNIRNLSQLPPFDVASAYLLYQRLLQPFEAELHDARHIVAVLDRAMQNLPLSVLLATPVDAPPKRISDFSRLDFLSRHFAFSVEPSVSSFTVLRAVAKHSGAPKPFIGFGDPVLQGTGTATRGLLNDQLVTGVDPMLLRTSLIPLPETRDELTAVAHALKASDGDLYFGSRATKPMVMQTDLASYRILAFATHGLLAGEFRGIAEPALVLTPPATVSPGDNGLLTASEIATLRLDADWVLLSACNTAAPEGRAGAEGLSGLAKAFFYAGSRALLVSHWSVASQSTAELMTKATRTFAEEPNIGRAEALRRAMVSLLDGESQASFAHPIFWGPFVNVGEGGAN
jgi:CHAT domain-containing protein